MKRQMVVVFIQYEILAYARMGFSFAALGEPHNVLYNKLKTRGDGSAVGVDVATPISPSISVSKAKPLNVPMFRDHISQTPQP